MGSIAKCKHGYIYSIEDEKIRTSPSEYGGNYYTDHKRGSAPASLCPYCFLELCRNFNLMEYWRNAPDEES